MKIVIFGLAISSSWGNGHATVWRSLSRQLIARGHTVVFFERDVPYYASHRDLYCLDGGTLRLYNSWSNIVDVAERESRDADVGIVTSYCPDAIAASELIWCSPALRVFYDLDSPVTVASLRAGKPVPYIHPNGLAEFDVVLSFTGGAALELSDSELNHIAAAARERVLDEHTGAQRAQEFEQIIENIHATELAGAIT